MNWNIRTPPDQHPKMEQKKTHSRFGSHLFLTRKSESEDKSESSSDAVSRLTAIENQNKEIIRRYEDMRRQNDKIIQQNETILEMLETQMKLILGEKNLSKSNQGAMTTMTSNPNDDVQLSSQSLAISNPLYKYNNMTTTSSSMMNDKPDGKQVRQQQASRKKSQPLRMGRSQPIQKISRAVAVWQVCSLSYPELCLAFLLRIQHRFPFRWWNLCQQRYRACRSSFWANSALCSWIRWWRCWWRLGWRWWCWCSFYSCQ